jgi:hypothetical protein
MYRIVYTCKDCKTNTTLDYFSPDGETCLDCMTEEQWAIYEQAKDEGTLDLYRDADCVVENV